MIVSFYGFWNRSYMGNYGFSSGWRGISAPIRINVEASGQKGAPFWETQSLSRGYDSCTWELGKSRGNPWKWPRKNQHTIQMSYFDIYIYIYLMGYFSIMSDIFLGWWWFTNGFGGTQGFSQVAGAAQRCQATFADGVCFGGAAGGGCETRMKQSGGLFFSGSILGG